MKKLMFSAIALVAFSFAGMANNEVKEEKVDLKRGPYECVEYALQQLEAAQAAVDFPFSLETEVQILTDAMSNCD